MDYRRLGSSGLKVSKICLGTASFGERTSAATAARIVHSAVDGGVNFIDTADSYGARPGDAERIVGRLIARERHRWVLATKVSRTLDRQDPNSGGLSRKWMIRAIDGSLKRLATDYIDIYYLHHDDYNTPLEETLCTLGDCIHAGKVRYFGVSNFQAWRIAELVKECERIGVPKPIVVQPFYHALYRVAEVEILPASAHLGMGIVPYAPLARGMLTGKYLPGKSPPKDSRGGRGQRNFLDSEYRAESLQIVQQLKKHAESKGIKLAHFALNWVLNNALVTAVLTGPRTLEHWRDYLAALNYNFDAADEALVDSFVPRGHSSTPGHTDRKYTVAGRIARAP